ncbi:MAG: UvrD-helicase domain-containing protein [Fretibacterium sp.]|nr:UvrD-helicase domain-containing protein [Fretibacterium sp.]
MDKKPDPFFPEGTPDGQRRAVTARGSLITVGAGAGTGKTWVLSNRYARLLIEAQRDNTYTPLPTAERGELLPRDILTLTYTEAAANEMRARIENRVRDLLSRTAIDAKRKEMITDGFCEAWISTIHSFAARLIRESGLALDVDPRATIISDSQEERFWDSIREGVEFANLRSLASVYGDASLQAAASALDSDSILSAAVGRWGAVRLSALARDAAELHASLGHCWQQMMTWGTDGGDELFQAVRDPVTTILRGAWRRAWDTWSEILSTLGEAIQAKGQKDRETGKANSADALLLECLECWGEAINTNPDDETLRAFYLHVTDKAKLKGRNTNLLKEVKSFLGTTLAVWQDGEAGLASVSAALNTPIPEPERQLHAVLLRFCSAAWGLWDSMKRRRGLLSFSDIILHAREALRTGELERSFRHILVDEFQDTDPLQFDMILSLAESSGQTSLFAVGDPKQSIYGFRHAEPSLFAKTISQAETRVDLDVSFRTRASLLERINDLFTHIWREGLGTSGVLSRLKFEPLSPANTKEERNKGTVPPFSVLLSIRSKRPLDETREQLARELGHRIASWVQEGRTVWDKEGQILRPVRYGDFAVLVRNRGTHDLLERVFAAQSVPAVQDLSRGYFARGEVEDVICLLRAAADPEDDAAVAGWLLSPFSGVPEADAVALLEQTPNRRNNSVSAGQQKGASSLTASPQHLIDAIRASLPEAMSALQRFSIIGQQQGPARLLSLLDRDRRWLACYKGCERLRTLRNVRRAISIARDFQRDSASSLTACADWMAHALRQGVVMEEPTWHGKEVNAVLLSTIHASKGLEYPIVALFDTAARKAAARDGLRPSKTLGIVFSSLPDEMTDGKTTPFLQGAAWDGLLAAQGELEEDMRLLYVAATRAQDGLLVCGLLGEKDGLLTPQKNSWTSLFLERMAARGECPPMEGGITPEALAVPTITLISDNAQPLPGKSDKREGLPAPAPRRVPLPGKEQVLLSQISATSFALYEWCPLAWRRRYRQGLDLRWESPDRDLLAEDGRGGAELGSLAHWLLSHWASLESGDELTELNTWLTDERVIHRLPSYLRDVWREEKSREELGKWLKRFADSDAGKTVCGALAQGAVREAGFRVNLRGDTAGVTLAGAMDLVWRERDSGLWHVMDYKITLSRKAPPGLYGAQLDFYALAVREAALREGMPCEAVDVGLVFLREDSRVELRRLAENDWEGLKIRVLDAARRGAAGDNYPPNLSHCSSCPWKTGCPALKAKEAAA